MWTDLAAAGLTDDHGSVPSEHHFIQLDHFVHLIRDDLRDWVETETHRRSDLISVFS